MSVNSPALRVSRSKLNIEPRRVKFEFDDFDSPLYYDKNGCLSAMWVALSASFPAGEGEFIKSVKLYEDQISEPKLKQEVKNFVHQEAHHSLQHKHINKMFDDLGYDAAGLHDFFTAKLKEREQKWSPERRLARTVCAEHVTAVMANHALTHPEHMAKFPASFRNLFLWHSIEEIEHKSVAFDVYTQCVNDRKLLHREYKYFLRREFPFNLYMSSRFLLKKMGHKATWKERAGLLRALYGKGGLFSAMRPLYKSFLSENFHPWNHDDSALVAEFKQTLAPYFIQH